MILIDFVNLYPLFDPYIGFDSLYTKKWQIHCWALLIP